jgi:hypothetical protein
MRIDLPFRSFILGRRHIGTLIALFIAACAQVKEPPRYLDEGDHHVIRLEKAESSAAYSHPADLDLVVWENALKSIVVSHPVSFLKRIFIQKNEIVGPAFTPEEVAFLSTRFKAAAERATPAEHIAFLLTSDKNHLATEITSGVAFLKDGALYLILANHHTPLSGQRYPQVPRDTMMRPYEHDGFQLVAQPHQAKMERDLLERGQEGLSINFAALGTASQPAPDGSEKKETTSLGEFKLEERLQLLKKLRDDGLITEEEYTEKKKELLKLLDVK